MIYRDVRDTNLSGRKKKKKERKGNKIYMRELR